MSSIDAVIARARRPGAFSERQTFTLARTRAIQKMRHFALADPHFFVLELVQASIASGAVSVSIEADDDSFTLSYVGGGFPEAGLTNLFDFLFASKERTEFAALRALALGVNALLLFHPERLVIESGDGTLPGTTRMEIRTGDDQLDIGRPDRALFGTFIRVDGMKRARMSRELKIRIAGDGNDERSIIEQRCICAPVPICFNGDAVFGHASLRIPRTFGYTRQIDFDEGDLFGSLGYKPRGGVPSFRLLTHGVWIESIQHDLIGDAPLGGTINHNILHKTADHARIVRDERLEDLWVRIRPYAEMLMRGATTAREAYEVSIFGGMRLPAKQLRLFLREIGQVVIIPPSVRETSNAAKLAQRIARSLDAELLTAEDDQIERLRILAGRDVSIITPDLSSPDDLAVYTRAPAQPPLLPWLLAPIEGPPLTVAQLVSTIAEEVAPKETAPKLAPKIADESLSSLAKMTANARTERHQSFAEAALGSRGSITTTIYTPTDLCGRSTLEVRLTTCGREVATVNVVSMHAGHLITAELPALRPGVFLATREFAEATAVAIVRHVSGNLRDASRRALYGLDPDTLAPSTPEAHLALAALQRSCVVRMRRDRESGRAKVTISPTETIDGLDLLGLPLLRTLGGRELSVRELPALIERGHGVIYGVIPEVAADLTDLDVDRILDLDAETEGLLIALLGAASYVRVDARDVLAEHVGMRIRDLALGLRPYPEGPLLLEGTDPAPLGDEARTTAEHSLYAQLLHLYLDPPSEAADPALAEELRHQAWRHIQRYLCSSIEAGIAEPLGVDVVIAEDASGTGYSLREIMRVFEAGESIVANYDHGALPTGSLRAGPDSPPLRELQISPFFFAHLSKLGHLALPFDFDLGDEDPSARADGRKAAESMAKEAFLATIEVDEAGLRGVLGIPLAVPEAARIILLDPKLRVLQSLPGIADDFGVVGALHVEGELSEASLEPLFAALHRAAAAALQALAQQLPEFTPGSAEQARALDVLLEHAGRNLSLVATPSGAIAPSTTTEIAAQILNIPLFPGLHGLPVSASSLLSSLALTVRQRPGEAISGVSLVATERLDALRRTWLERHLHSGKIARPAQTSRANTPAIAGTPERATTPSVFDSMTLCATLVGWIDALRPDEKLDAEVPGARTSIWMATDDAYEKNDRPCSVTPAGGTSALVYLNPDHWLVRWAQSRGAEEQKPIAWLLLAVYAEINALLSAVTNSHEQEFQRRVGAALQEGRLTPLAPQAPVF